jgi:hypothetical protein
MAQLFPDLNPTANGKIFEPYNMRKTLANDLMIKYTDFPQDYAYLPAAVPPVVYNNVSYYNQSIPDTRAGVAGTFTPVSTFNVRKDVYIFRNGDSQELAFHLLRIIS